MKSTEELEKMYEEIFIETRNLHESINNSMYVNVMGQNIEDRRQFLLINERQKLQIDFNSKKLDIIRNEISNRKIQDFKESINPTTFKVKDDMSLKLRRLENEIKD